MILVSCKENLEVCFLPTPALASALLVFQMLESDSELLQITHGTFDLPNRGLELSNVCNT